MISKQTYGQIIVGLFFLAIYIYGSQIKLNEADSFFQFICWTVFFVVSALLIYALTVISLLSLNWLCFKSNTIGFIDYWKNIF